MEQGGLRIIGLTAGLLMAAACSSSVPPAARYDGPAGPPAPVYQPRPVADECGAGGLQTLVGQPRTEIPVPVEITNRRVTCTDCPLTEDYSASRLNILFNRETGLVERVYCG